MWGGGKEGHGLTALTVFLRRRRQTPRSGGVSRGKGAKERECGASACISKQIGNNFIK